MVGKYFGEIIPSELDSIYRDGHTVAQKAQVIGELVGGLTPEGLTEIQQQLQSSLNFSGYLARVQALVKWADDVLSQMKPWKERETPEGTQRVRTQALYQACEMIRLITALLYPVMPYATASVWRQLGLGSIEEAARNGELKNLQWGGLKPGTKLGPLAPIFPRADKGLAQIMTDMENPTPPPAPAPASSEPTAESLNAVSPSTEEQAALTAPLPVAPTITIDD